MYLHMYGKVLLLCCKGVHICILMHIRIYTLIYICIYIYICTQRGLLVLGAGFAVVCVVVDAIAAAEDEENGYEDD